MALKGNGDSETYPNNGDFLNVIFRALRLVAALLNHLLRDRETVQSSQFIAERNKSEDLGLPSALMILTYMYSPELSGFTCMSA